MNFSIDRNRGLARWSNYYRNQHMPWCHSYCFSLEERAERMLTIECGFDSRSRELLAETKPCRVNLSKVPKRLIDRLTYRQQLKPSLPCIDLTDDEGSSSQSDGFSRTKLVDQMLDFFRGKCQWALAPGFLEHVIAGGEVPNNPISNLFKQLFAPTGVLVQLLGNEIKNCNWSQHAMNEYGKHALSIEQHNQLLVKLGILKKVAIQFGSSVPMTELILKYKHILSNSKEMIRLTTLPSVHTKPNVSSLSRTLPIPLVQNSNTISLLSNISPVRNSNVMHLQSNILPVVMPLQSSKPPVRNSKSISVQSNYPSVRNSNSISVQSNNPPVRKSNLISLQSNNTPRTNGGNLSYLPSQFAASPVTNTWQQPNNIQSYNRNPVKEFIKSVEKDAPVIDVIDLSSDDDCETASPAKRLKVSVGSSNRVRSQMSHPLNGGDSNSFITTPPDTHHSVNTTNSVQLSKNELSHWSAFRNSTTGRKAICPPVTNGLSVHLPLTPRKTRFQSAGTPDHFLQSGKTRAIRKHRRSHALRAFKSSTLQEIPISNSKSKPEIETSGKSSEHNASSFYSNYGPVLIPDLLPNDLLVPVVCLDRLESDNNNYLSSSPSEHDMDSLFNDKPTYTTLDKRKAKRKVVCGYDSEYELEQDLFHSPLHVIKNKKLKSNNSSIYCDICKHPNCSCNLSLADNSNNVELDEIDLCPMPNVDLSDVADLENEICIHESSPPQIVNTDVTKKKDPYFNIIRDIHSFINRGVKYLKNSISGTSEGEDSIAKPLLCTRIENSSIKVCTSTVPSTQVMAAKCSSNDTPCNFSNKCHLNPVVVLERLPISALKSIMPYNESLQKTKSISSDVRPKYDFSVDDASGYRSSCVARPERKKSPGIMDSLMKRRKPSTDGCESTTTRSSDSVCMNPSTLPSPSNSFCSNWYAEPSDAIAQLKNGHINSKGDYLQSVKNAIGKSSKRNLSRELKNLISDEFKEVGQSTMHPRDVYEKYKQNSDYQSLTSSSRKKIDRMMATNRLSEVGTQFDDTFDTDVEDNDILSLSSNGEECDCNSLQKSKPLRERSMELKRLLADECKELKQLGFHPSDIVDQSVAENNESSDESESSLSTESEIQVTLSPGSVSDSSPRKVNWELANLFIDEYKEFHQDKNRSRYSRPELKDFESDALTRNLDCIRSMPRKARMAKVSLANDTSLHDSPRRVQRSLIHHQDSMCAISYLLPPLV